MSWDFKVAAEVILRRDKGGGVNTFPRNAREGQSYDGNKKISNALSDTESLGQTIKHCKRKIYYCRYCQKKIKNKTNKSYMCLRCYVKN